MNEFKTIAAHIDDLRELLRQTSDDTIWSDKYLYKKLLDARSVLIKRELDKSKLISEFNYNTICINMEPGVPLDCGCSDLQCKVLVSTQPLPKPFQIKFRLLLEILDGSYSTIPEGGIIKSKYLKHYKTLKSKRSWTIINNRLVVYDADLRIKSLIVKILADDPSELENFSYSNTCGCTTPPANPTPCFDVATSNFPIDSWLNMSMYELVRDHLLKSAINEDVSNNAQSNLNGQ